MDDPEPIKVEYIQITRRDDFGTYFVLLDVPRLWYHPIEDEL